MSTANPLTQNLIPRRTMLSFAYLAYTGEGITTPNPEATIKANIEAALPQIIIESRPGGGSLTLASWDIVWGPVAYTVPGALYQQNLMYIANNTASGCTSQYVIAIRGTNFISEVDWLLEDFNVLNTMPWPIPGAQSKAQSGAAITESTSIDLNVLLGPNMTDNVQGELLTFLQSVTGSNPIDICVTGHSLGGVLSSTLALYLLENKSSWDKSGKSTVSCIGFAAPTAGNNLFATNANTVFTNAFSKSGATSFPGWDTTLGTNLDNVACSMDAATYFYNGTNIFNNGAAGALFSIYSKPNNNSNNINFANLPSPIPSTEWSYFQSLVLQSLAGVMTSQNYTQLQSQVLPGNFIGNSLALFTSDVHGTNTAVFPAYLDAFAAQVAWQHSSSYPVLLNVPYLFDPNIINRGFGPAAPVPTITGISPNKADRNPIGLTVTITGSGFDASNMLANFLVFSEPQYAIPYLITAATETQITVDFYPYGIGHFGQTIVQDVYVVTTSPYYTSNGITFTIT